MRKHAWLVVFTVGIILFFATEGAQVMTGNPNFLPTILLLGSFLIPVVFVIYFYDHVRHREISMPLLSATFIVGGIIGAITAGILEYDTLRGLGVGTLFGVGIIEEATKLIFPLIVYIGWHYRHEADGLLFGVSAGMGFAAIETMGYGMVYLIQSGGNIAGVQQLLITRGLLSPAEHAAWTGFVCAIIWREREHGHGAVFGWTVVGAFVVAVVLHALWDVVNNMPTNTAGALNFVVLANAALVVTSLSLLIYRYRKAKESLAKAAKPVPPAVPAHT